MIREAKVDDAAACANIKIVTWRYAYTGMIEQSVLDALLERQTEERWSQMIISFSESDRSACYVVEEAGKIVGYCFAGLLDASNWELDLAAIYILPEYHGRGFGKQLIQAILRHFSEVRSMIVWVLKDNKAEEFYTKLGGVKVESKLERIGDQEYLLHGYEYDQVVLNKLRD